MRDNLLVDAVPHIVAGLIVSAVVGLITWIAHRWRNRRDAVARGQTAAATDGTWSQQESDSLGSGATYPPRRYTLLNVTPPDGGVAQIASVLPVGTTVVHVVEGRVLKFVLTDTPLFDGSYVAEPLGRYL